MTTTTAIPRRAVAAAHKKVEAAHWLRVEVATTALKEDLALQIRQRLERDKMSQSDLARAMRTSRSVVHRLLHAGKGDSGITLETLAKAALALNAEVQIRVKAMPLTEGS